MAEQFAALSDELAQFITRQHLFFVATAAPDGRVNLSPKGMDSLRVLDGNHLVWLNLTGSGNETAAHLQRANRMTLMFCSFERQPMILRLYGSAQTLHPRDDDWHNHIARFPAATGACQLFHMQIDLVQTSCGYAVPLMEFANERKTLTKWADNKSQAGIADYWEEKNQLSLDGLPTHILPGSNGDE